MEELVGELILHFYYFLHFEVNKLQTKKIKYLTKKL